MGLNVTNYVLQMKGDKSIASGFDHATRTGDNTFSIYFIFFVSINAYFCPNKKSS